MNATGQIIASVHAKATISGVRIEDRGVAVDWDDGHLSYFHHIWLRDNCPCEACVLSSGERRMLAASIPADIVPESVAIGKDGELVLVWAEEGHRTCINANWLRAHCYSETARAKRRCEPHQWGAELRDSLPVFDHEQVLSDERTLLRWCEAVRDRGVALVRGAPVCSGEGERFSRFVGWVEETHQGRYYDAVITPRPAHIANFPVELLPHNDFAAYAWPMGLTLQYCLANEAEGGETILVDGYRVAAQLRAEQPAAFEVLTRVAVPFRVFDDRSDIINHGLVIELGRNGEPNIIRYNTHLRLPLDVPADQVEPYYDAHRKLSALIADPANRMQLKLAPGELLTLHNHRVLHGRTAHDTATGLRHMQIGWMNYDHLRSRIRVLHRTLS